MNKVCAVAMSGGVDSSTVAAILQKENYDIFGVTMSLHQYSNDAVENAKNVCEKLGIEHFVFNAENAFKKYVMDVFKDYYISGLTPNPCAFCNRDVKLNLLLQFAKEKGADLLATGHYANLNVNNDQVILSEASNKSKDQSYFLSLVTKDNLKYVRFPLGNIQDKSETRKLAASFGLHNFEKKDSQDICFIPNGNYKDFLHSAYPELCLQKPGYIKLIQSDEILGEHKGIVNYTIGQRKGLNVSYKSPLYVVNLDPNTNEVLVGCRDQLERVDFDLTQSNWLLDYPNEFEADVKLRSIAKKVRAKITRASDKTYVNLLEKSQTPVTKGQVCAVYSEANEVIGAGIIGY